MAITALWALSRLVDVDALPQRRVVVRFDVTDQPPPDRFWLVLGHTDREVCATAPGYAEDAIVATDRATLVGWHCGRIAFGHAVRAGTMRLTGPPWMAPTMTGWGRLSPFAAVTPMGR